MERHTRRYNIKMPSGDGTGEFHEVNWIVILPHRVEDGPNDDPNDPKTLETLHDSQEGWPICLYLHSRYSLTQPWEQHWRNAVYSQKLRRRYITIIPLANSADMPGPTSSRSPLLRCESEDGWHLGYNEQVVFRILEESIFRLSLDERIKGKTCLNLRAIHCYGYSMGGSAVLNLACTYGRYLAGAVSFGSSADEHLVNQESSTNNLRDLTVVCFEMERDKPEHKNWNFIERAACTGVGDRHANQKQVTNTYSFRVNHEEHEYHVTSFGYETPKFHIMINPINKRDPQPYHSLTTMEQHNTWSPILEKYNDFSFNDQGQPMKTGQNTRYFVQWMREQCRRRGPVVCLPEITFSLTMKKGPSPCLQSLFGCVDQGCVSNRYGLVVRAHEPEGMSDEDPKVMVAASREWYFNNIFLFSYPNSIIFFAFLGILDRRWID